MNSLKLDLTSIGVNLNCTGATYRQEHDHAIRQSIHNFSALFVKEDQDPYVYTVPISWWQHFKQTYFKGWLLKRFPIKTITHTLTVETIYPTLKTKLPTNLHGPNVCIAVAHRHMYSFMGDTAGLTPTKFREEVSMRLMSLARMDYRTCPACKRSLFDFSA